MMIWSAVTVTGAAEQDHFRVQALQLIKTQPEFREHAAAVVVDHHIAGADQPARQRRSRGRGEVERDKTLARVPVGEPRRALWLDAELRLARRDVETGHVGVGFRFDLDHIGTAPSPVSYTHLRAHETVLDLVCRLLLEKKNRLEAQHTYTYSSVRQK